MHLVAHRDPVLSGLLTVHERLTTVGFLKKKKKKKRLDLSSKRIGVGGKHLCQRVGGFLVPTQKRGLGVTYSLCPQSFPLPL